MHSLSNQIDFMRIAFTLLFAATTVASAAERPNFIIVFTDDHGYADLSSQGVFQDVRTPNIDALAKGGVRMTSGYSTAPQCVPSRAGLLTGKYQNRFGVESNGEPLDGFDAEDTIAERLKRVGYATGMIGKWHLGPTDQISQHGFDDVFYRGGSWTNFNFAGQDVAPGTVTNEHYHLDAGSLAANAFIERHHSEPFFLYLAYRAPHVPLDATKKYLDRFPGKMPERRRQALAMLSAVDDGVGGIMQSLRQHGIEENTVIFFVGDNGAPLKIHKLDAPGGGPGWDGSLNDPMNGEKGMLSEGGIRVPYVVYWKDRIPAGQTCNHPVIALDAAGTILPLAGCPPDPTIDGVNLLPVLTGETKKAPHDQLFWRWISQGAVREGDWKYLRGGDREYLFDLSKDKEEKHSVLKQNPDVANRLRSQFSQWSGELDPPGPATKPMSVTWEQYFDFYLDGKPAPPVGKRERPDSLTINGWITRNGRSEIKRGLLQVRPSKRGATPFIAANGLRMQGPMIAEVNLKTSQPGELKIQWRESKQKDFPSDQVVSVDCEGSQTAEPYQIEVPARGQVIHVRVILPSVGADVERILFTRETGETLRVWNFQK